MTKMLRVKVHYNSLVSFSKYNMCLFAKTFQLTANVGYRAFLIVEPSLECIVNCFSVFAIFGAMTLSIMTLRIMTIDII
jgi:hypothetical protein